MAKMIFGFEEKFLLDLRDVFRDSRLEEIEIEEEETYLRISKQDDHHDIHNVVSYVPAQSVAPFAEKPAEEKHEAKNVAQKASEEVYDETKYYKVKSPLVGTFYEAPSPTSPPFVKLGDIVMPDTTLCIIEAMKVMNEIKAEVKGKIVKILKKNASPVKTDEEIFIIEKM
ncbi:MAG: acetyl-CoA carboxylase biotin carboxyl carrier protein [Brevinematia bacterium]